MPGYQLLRESLRVPIRAAFEAGHDHGLIVGVVGEVADEEAERIRRHLVADLKSYLLGVDETLDAKVSALSPRVAGFQEVGDLPLLARQVRAAIGALARVLRP